MSPSSLDPGLSGWILTMFVDDDCVLWEEEDDVEEAEDVVEDYD